ncbi:MAG: HigA family addiction module antidote protein [Bacteroidales bacterium]|nr:HigA family addiction module antidote protein [Bacteroidales bacterium]
MLKSPTTTNKLPNVHPGDVLKEEFLLPMNVSVGLLSDLTKIPESKIIKIINGESAITAGIAIRLSRFFGTTSEFWLNLQNLYDLEEENSKHKVEFEKIKMYQYA